MVVVKRLSDEEIEVVHEALDYYEITLEVEQQTYETDKSYAERKQLLITLQKARNKIVGG